MAILLHSHDGSNAQQSAVFWWDGKHIGWVRSGHAIDVGKLCGLYTTDPLDNFGVGELQAFIDSGWVGGPMPPGFNPPSAVDSSVT